MQTIKRRLIMEQRIEKHLYPEASKDLSQKRKELAPEIYAAFQSFSQHVFADGALPSKTKELIAVAVAHVTQCPYCIRGHTKRAAMKGATGRRLWKRFGLLPRCGQAPRLRILRWPLMR